MSGKIVEAVRYRRGHLHSLSRASVEVQRRLHVQTMRQLYVEIHPVRKQPQALDKRRTKDKLRALPSWKGCQ
jgi:hypothetical protein